MACRFGIKGVPIKAQWVCVLAQNVWPIDTNDKTVFAEWSKMCMKMVRALLKNLLIGYYYYHLFLWYKIDKKCLVDSQKYDMAFFIRTCGMNLCWVFCSYLSQHHVITLSTKHKRIFMVLLKLNVAAASMTLMKPPKRPLQKFLPGRWSALRCPTTDSIAACYDERS